VVPDLPVGGEDEQPIAGIGSMRDLYPPCSHQFVKAAIENGPSTHSQWGPQWARASIPPAFYEVMERRGHHGSSSLREHCVRSVRFSSHGRFAAFGPEINRHRPSMTSIKQSVANLYVSNSDSRKCDTRRLGGVVRGYRLVAVQSADHRRHCPFEKPQSAHLVCWLLRRYDHWRLHSGSYRWFFGDAPLTERVAFSRMLHHRFHTLRHRFEFVICEVFGSPQRPVRGDLHTQSAGGCSATVLSVSEWRAKRSFRRLGFAASCGREENCSGRPLLF
jgi:hypothetical protein